MRGLFIPEITAEMFRNGCLESIEALIAEGEIYDIDYPLKQEPCDDAINRDELLKAIDTWDKSGCDADTKLVPYQDHYIPYIHYDDVIKCIKGMPSVKPQEPRKKGKWICVQHPENKITYDSWKCSECQHDFNSEEESMVDFDEYNYCPNCGAKMEGGE